MAQLGARLDGIEEVVGSNPIGSTNFTPVYFLYILQSESTNARRSRAPRLATTLIYSKLGISNEFTPAAVHSNYTIKRF